ncbi:hypothetical protein BN135_1980 [Cronobacter muytjensii 530]|nr:hypothetical protein [Cronobacter muytjensii]
MIIWFPDEDEGSETFLIVSNLFYHNDGMAFFYASFPSGIVVKRRIFSTRNYKSRIELIKN